MARVSAVITMGPRSELPAKALAAGAAHAGVDGAGARGAKAAFDYAGSINNHPQLTQEEKHSLLWVLAQAPSFHGLIQPHEIGGHELVDWVKCTGCCGIQISRQDPVPPERTFKMRGVAEIPLSTEVAYDLVTEFEHMQKWDHMLQSLEVLDSAPKAYPLLRIGTFINTYGVPGMSWLFNDRQFLCRGISVHFPDGTRALAAYTPSDPHPADGGVTKPRTVRAHMGVSGYVVSPWADEERRCLGPDKCQVTMVLQVDPKGGVPVPVYNSVSMMMPMNLQRIKAAAAKLKPCEKAAMLQRQLDVVATSRAEAAASAGARRQSGGGGGGGGGGAKKKGGGGNLTGRRRRRPAPQPQRAGACRRERAGRRPSADVAQMDAATAVPAAIVDVLKAIERRLERQHAQLADFALRTAPPPGGRGGCSGGGAAAAAAAPPSGGSSACDGGCFATVDDFLEAHFPSDDLLDPADGLPPPPPGAWALQRQPSTSCVSRRQASSSPEGAARAARAAASPGEPGPAPSPGGSPHGKRRRAGADGGGPPSGDAPPAEVATIPPWLLQHACATFSPQSCTAMAALRAQQHELLLGKDATGLPLPATPGALAPGLLPLGLGHCQLLGGGTPLAPGQSFQAHRTMNRAVLLALLGLALVGSAADAAWTPASSACDAAAPPAEFGGPVTDLKTLVNVTTTATGLPTDALCPGVLYKVKAKFPERRKFIATTTLGSFAGADTACPNRMVNSAGTASVVLPLTLPCGAAGTATLSIAGVLFNKTSANTYKLLTLPLPIAALSACPASTCVADASSGAGATAAGDMPNLNLAFDLNSLLNPTGSANPLAGLATIVQGLVAAGTGGAAAASNASVGTDHLSGLLGALQTLGALVNPAAAANSGAAAGVPDVSDFLGALGSIAALANPSSAASSSSTTSSPGSGILSLLGSLQTLQSTLGGAAATGEATPSGLANVLGALKSVGALLNPTASAAPAAASPLSALMSSGQNLMSSVSALMPADGASSSPNLNLGATFKFVLSVGDFFSKLSALAPRATSG
ncbi:hypothetical protein HT031_001591 [Scenedesmus sp. PABB004]|nr:hypothetical protein HT031_001591 [Scenedesmus sp. PABB004]